MDSPQAPTSQQACWPTMYFYWADQQKDIFRELHYNRFTYYPLHDRARIDRDYGERAF